MKSENKVWMCNDFPREHALNDVSNKWHVCLEMYTSELPT